MKRYRIVPLPSSVEYGDAEFEFGKIALEGEGFEERYLTRMLMPEAEFVRPEEADEKTLVVARHRNGALPDEGCEIRIKGGRVDIASRSRRSWSRRTARCATCSSRTALCANIAA